MIFGETTAAYCARVTTWRRWFAWHPVELDDGRFALFCYVERERRHFREVSWWVYRLPPRRSGQIPKQPNPGPRQEGEK